MYNILEVEDKIKGLPDQALMKEAQFPSGDVPQFLIVSELQRRNEMRKSYSAMQEPTQTVPVAQQVVAEAGQGIVGMMGGNPMPMQAQAPMPMAAPMQAQTPMAAPMQSSMPAPMQPPVPQPQAPAGIVAMAPGRTVPGISSGGPGVGNNNPFNIKDFNQNWRGQTGATDGFVDFSSTDYGIRAADRLLGNYDVNTIRDIISKYAPDSENNTEGYINFVSDFLNIPEDAPIDLNDPDARRSVLSAIAKMETGSDISPLEISDAVSRLTPSGGGQMRRNAPERNTARAAAELSAIETATANIDYANSLNNPASVTEFLGDYSGVPYGMAMESIDSSSTGSSPNVNTPALLKALGLKDTSTGRNSNALTEDINKLSSYNSGIMDLTKSGREDISRLRGEINELNIPQASLTEREFIADDIDRQSYIDRLSSIAGEDIASREVLIDELQEKSKKDALSAFLMSFGAGVAGGDLSGGIEQGSKAAQDVKQIADKRLFDERKSMRDVKSAAEREAVQLGLSAEEAELAGRRAEQKFVADQEALRNTVEFQNYTASRQQLLDQIAGAREDVTTIATLIKNERDIINDANRIKADMARESGTERRNIRDYIGDLVQAQRDTLEASIVGIKDPNSITKLVDAYRSLLEKKLGLPSSAVFDQTSVDELLGASEIDTSQFSIDR